MSLRSRLVLTHVFVIVLTLAILGFSLIFILRNYQRNIQLARLADAVVPLAFQARAMFQNDVPPKEALARLEQQAGETGRVMIVTENGLVLADAANGLTSRTVQLNRSVPNRVYYWGAYILRGRPGNPTLLYAAVPAGQFKGQTVYVALSSVERNVGSALIEIIPSLVIAGLVTLAISVLSALLLARSISKPISRLTAATQAFADGHYEHRVQARGSTEIDQLGKSFNAMADRVQSSRQMEKDFVANVSHELKTPLTSIQGFSQAILDGAVADMDGARRAAQTIFDETARMGRLVGDLLTLARFESGELPLANEKLDLGQLLPCWVDRLQPRAKTLGQNLLTVIDPLPPIMGDAGKLDQVVTNLVDNALKYNRAGGTVTVSAKSELATPMKKSGFNARRRVATAPPVPWVRISVSDDGPGIRQEDLPRIFERFYRGDKARVAGGTGLGLAITHEIVTAHKGKITVTSELGKGTVFTVLLPAQP